MMSCCSITRIAQGGCRRVLRSSQSNVCAVHICCEQQQHYSSPRGQMHFQRSRSTLSSAHHERHASTRSLSLSVASATLDSPTLFSLPGLSHPSDFAQLANKAIRECNSIRQELAAALNEEDDGVNTNQVQKAKRTLHLLDDISNVVCTVIDAAELCRSVHASPLWRNGASDAFGILSEYIGSLNADDRLYRSLRRFVFNDGDKGSNMHGSSGIIEQLPPEYQRMAHAMRKEFERDGIHLEYTQREEARELNDVIVGLESLFSNNITEKTKYYKVGEEMAAEVEKVIPSHVLGQLVRRDNPSSDGSMTLSSDNLLTNTLLAHSPSPQLRKEVYMESNTAIPENLNVLDALIQQRHIHSTLLGYKSYAHRVLSDRMVENPQNVVKFLDEMGKRSRGMFEKEMELMMRAKQYVEGDNQIQAWDVPFYSNFIKAQRQYHRSQDEGGDSDDSTQGYFTVENSIDGMKTLVSDLFGIEMKEVEIPIEERWDIDITRNAQAQLADGAGLRKFEFHHEHDGALGSMYFDLHPRDGKFVHAAHFTIRCGRNREDDVGSDRQLPIVALVCNLSPSSSDSDALLSHSEVGKFVVFWQKLSCLFGFSTCADFIPSFFARNFDA
jgi:intermediate peptidase